MNGGRTTFGAGCFMGTGPNGRRFVYVQVPKVACTSIKAALLPVYGLDPPAEGFAVHRAFWGSDVRVSKQKLARPPFADVYRFSFVRNPFDRLVSAYFSKVLSSEKRLLRQPGVRTGMPFGEFAEVVCAAADEGADPHVRSQWTFLDGVRMDFVGRMEEMAEGYAEVARAIGVPPELPHSNRSGDRGRYRAYYDDELADKVAARYRTDLDAFGYSF